MAIRKTLPGPGNPVFYFWAANFTSELLDHPNVVPLAFVNVTRPNQSRPPGYPVLQPGDFGGDNSFDLAGGDQSSWNAWRKSLGGFGHPDWTECIKCHLRACARAAADCFYECGYFKGTGSRGNGLYESGVGLNEIGTFRNSKQTDVLPAEWYDTARLYAHPADAASATDPDPVMTLLHNGTLYLPGVPSSPNMGELKASLYTPWCENGIAEVAPLVRYFAQQLKAECDARNLCYPAELVIDSEQSPISWPLAMLDSSHHQIGSFNNIRNDPRAASSTVYEIQSSPGVYVPVTYNDHFDAHEDFGGNSHALSDAVGDHYDGYMNVPVVHRMLWRLYTFAYDYAEHKAIYEPWKSVFPGSKCGNYEVRFVPVEGENPLIINYTGDVRVFSEHVRADFSSPVLYPNRNRPGYGGNTNPYHAFIADSKDIVSQCDKAQRDFRGWIQAPTVPDQKLNSFQWNPDRFGTFVAEMDSVGGHGFYIFSDPSWSDANDALVTDAVERALLYSDRASRGLDPVNIGAGKRR